MARLGRGFPARGAQRSSIGRAADTTTQSLSLSGAITSAGVIFRAAKSRLAGAITPAGVVTRTAKVLLTGTIVSAGAVVHKVSRALAGAIAPAGTIVSKVMLILEGVIDSVGSVLSATPLYLSLSGTISSVGELFRTRVFVRRSARIRGEGTVHTNRLGGGHIGRAVSHGTFFGLKNRKRVRLDKEQDR